MRKSRKGVFKLVLATSLMASVAPALAVSFMVLHGLVDLDKRERIAWALERIDAFFPKLSNNPSAFGSWAQYGPIHENKMYNHWFRMTKEGFKELLHHIQDSPHVKRKDTNFRKAWPVAKRLAMTLIWLSHGPHYKLLGEVFGTNHSMAHIVIHGTVKALRAYFKANTTIKFPKGTALQQTMADFQEIGGMPGCAGAIDGCFIPIIKPRGPWGSRYWCYKNF